MDGWIDAIESTMTLDTTVLSWRPLLPFISLSEHIYTHLAIPSSFNCNQLFLISSTTNLAFASDWTVPATHHPWIFSCAVHTYTASQCLGGGGRHCSLDASDPPAQVLS